MIHGFQPSITATRDEALRPPKGFRFGNFEGIKVLPSVGTGHVAGQHAKSYFNNRQIFFTICDWFETWMPWQKRIVLCGTTDRCSNRQLECLATALEPVFHRDFITALKGYYPRKPLKKPKHATNHEALVRALQMATEGTDLDPRSRLLAKKKHEMEEFALVFVKGVIQEAVNEHVAAEKDSVETLTDDVSHSDEVPSACSSMEHESRHASLEQVEHEQAVSDKSNTPDCQSPQQNSTRDLADEKTSSQLVADASVVSQSKSNKEQCDRAESKLDDDQNIGYPSAQRLRRTRLLTNKLTEHKVTSFDEVAPTSSKLPPLDAKKASTLSWCMTHQLSSSLPSTPVSGNSAKLSHRHNSNVSSVDIGSASDFFENQRRSRLGSMHGAGALRSGQIKKPHQVQDVYVPLQKAYKNAKLWHGANTKGTVSLKPTTKAKKSTLKEHFKEQVKQIWQWLADWEDHEKSDLLVELIKLCDQTLIKFFAQCLVQRLLGRYQWLQDRSDVNSLPDKLLFYIFTFLSAEDINIAEKVCRRWHYIAAQDELWRIKCEELGIREKIPNLVEMVEGYMEDNSVDWKEAYGEMCRITINAKFMGHDSRRPGWLNKGPSRQCHLLNINFEDLLKRTPVPMESIQHIPSDSESSSEESLYSHRRMSTVVDVPIHFMQTAYGGDDEGSTGGATSNDEGGTPDMQGYRGSSMQKSRNDDDQQDSLEKDAANSRQGAAKIKRKVPKKHPKAGQDDFALDIRPDPVQAKDILVRSPSNKDTDLEDDESRVSPRKIVVNPVKRVRRLQGHMDAVFCLMFDKRRIVTGSMDRTIRVWDIRSGRSIRKIYGHKGGIRCLQFDEDKIISGSWDTTIMVWDIVHFDCLAVLNGHSDVVTCLRFVGNHLVTGSSDKTIRVWSLSDYQCVRIIETHTEEVTCLMFDGTQVTSGSADKSIRVTNIHTGECILHIDGIPEPVTALDLQGELILSGTMGGKLFFWNRYTGECEAGVQPHDTPIYNVSFQPQGNGTARFLTAAGDGTIKEWDLYSMTCVRALHGHRGPVRDVQVTQDRVVSCSDDGNVRIWDLYTPSLKPGTKAADDTIETMQINQRKDK